MKAFIKTFKYPSSVDGSPKEREILVINEDENRIGGVVLTDLPNRDEVISYFSDREVAPFTGKKILHEAGYVSPYKKLNCVYKAFTKSKIL